MFSKSAKCCTYGFYLFDVMPGRQLVEAREEIVQHPYYGFGREAAAKRCEAHLCGKGGRGKRERGFVLVCIYV